MPGNRAEMRERTGIPIGGVSKLRLQVASDLLRHLRNELNLGEVLIFC